MRWYMDASVAVHAVLPAPDRRARAWLDDVAAMGDEVFSSRLLELELIRALRRERLDVGRAQLVLKRSSLVSVNDGVLRVAAAIEPHIKTLDAIHLATCSMLGSGVTLATHDARMAEVARTVGIDALDPLEDA